jgi:hypothetical protein
VKILKIELELERLTSLGRIKLNRTKVEELNADYLTNSSIPFLHPTKDAGKISSPQQKVYYPPENLIEERGKSSANLR